MIGILDERTGWLRDDGGEALIHVRLSSSLPNSATRSVSVSAATWIDSDLSTASPTPVSTSGLRSALTTSGRPRRPMRSGGR